MVTRLVVAAALTAVIWQQLQPARGGDGPRGCVPDELTGIFRDPFLNEPQTYRDLLLQAYSADEDVLRAVGGNRQVPQAEGFRAARRI